MPLTSVSDVFGELDATLSSQCAYVSAQYFEILPHFLNIDADDCCKASEGTQSTDVKWNTSRKWPPSPPCISRNYIAYVLDRA